jgi:hypothetical protein
MEILYEFNSLRDNLLVLKAGPWACFPHSASKDIVFHKSFHNPCSQLADEALIYKVQAQTRK